MCYYLQHFRNIWPVYCEPPYPNFIYPDVFHFKQMVNQPSGSKAGWAFWKGFKIINKRMARVHPCSEAVWANTEHRAQLRLNVEKWKLHLSGARRQPRWKMACSRVQHAQLCQPSWHWWCLILWFATGRGSRRLASSTKLAWHFCQAGGARLIHAGTDNLQHACPTPLALIKFRWPFFSQELLCGLQYQAQEIWIPNGIWMSLTWKR